MSPVSVGVRSAQKEVTSQQLSVVPSAATTGNCSLVSILMRFCRKGKQERHQIESNVQTSSVPADGAVAGDAKCDTAAFDARAAPDHWGVHPIGRELEVVGGAVMIDH